MYLVCGRENHSIICLFYINLKEYIDCCGVIEKATWEKSILVYIRTCMYINVHCNTKPNTLLTT